MSVHPGKPLMFLGAAEAEEGSFHEHSGWMFLSKPPGFEILEGIMGRSG